MSGEHGDGRARSALLPAMYSPAAHRPVRAGEGGLRPATTCSTPGCWSTRGRSTPICGRSPWSAAGRLASPPRCTAASGVGQVPGRQHRRPRRDVPVVPGHPRGEGLHPRPGPGAAGDDQRRPGPARLDSRRRCTRRSISACPARDVRGTARPGSTWRRTSPRCWTTPTRGRLRPRVHYALGWLPRWGRLITRSRLLAPVVNLTTATPGLRRIVRWSAGVDQRRSAAPVRRPTGARASGSGRRLARPGTGDARWWSGWTRSRTASPAAGSRPWSTCCSAAGYAPQFLDRTACCGLTWISTGQRDGARRQLRQRSGRAAPVRGRGHADRRTGAVLHRGLAQRRRRAAARRPAGGRGRGRGAHPRRAAGPHAGLVAARPDRRRDRRPAALPPRRRCSAGRPTPQLLAATGSDGHHASAAAAGWPATSGSSRATTTCR